MRRGSAAPTRTPMACCASTYPRALTCRCSRKPNSTPSPPGSTAGRARRLALRHPMRCSLRWWTRPPTPSRHEMRRVFVMELESAGRLRNADQFKALAPFWILPHAGSWALYELYAALVTGAQQPNALGFDIRAALHAILGIDLTQI